MHWLRILLVAWLSFTVPTAVFASLASIDSCGRGLHVTAPMNGAADGVAHGEHAAHAAAADRDAGAGCQGDCYCVSHDCHTGSASGVLSAYGSGVFPTPAMPVSNTGVVRLASAHSRDLLRPPALI